VNSFTRFSRWLAGDAAGNQQAPDPRDVNAMFEATLAQDPESRPHYVWATLRAARSARDLGHDAVSVAEFGVAGGNGLLALERAADAAARFVGIDVEVFGFDTGTGMPEPADERDLPYLIREGFFPMDEAALRSRLAHAHLVLGPVGETVDRWRAARHPPLGFAAFDLDYYSSTVDALQLLGSGSDHLLPRVVCYFDDILGFAWSDFNGARAAISDFNRDHDRRKVGGLHGLRFSLPPTEFSSSWPEKIFLTHLFDHPRYSDREGEVAQVWHDIHKLAGEQ
jgi:hypothetical protein